MADNSEAKSSLSNNNRAAAGVIGALFVFSFVVIGFSMYQATEVPEQNKAVEADHYERVQGQLTTVQASIIEASSTGQQQSVTVDLGPTYPSRIAAVNPAPPAGRLRLTTVGGMSLDTTEDSDLSTLCNQNSVTDKALIYTPGYNYFNGGDVQHRIEGTLLYQAASAQGTALARAGPSLVNANTRTVRLAPLSGTLQEGGVSDQSVTFTGGYTESTTVNDAEITIATTAGTASDSLWAQQYSSVADVSASQSGTQVTITLQGPWTINCAPVAIGEAPAQLPTADAGEDVSIVEGDSINLDGTESAPEDSIVSYTWSEDSRSVSLQDADTATPSLRSNSVSSNTEVPVELTTTDTNGQTSTDSITIAINNRDNPRDEASQVEFVSDSSPATATRALEFEIRNGGSDSVTVTDFSISTPGNVNSDVDVVDNIDKNKNQNEVQIGGGYANPDQSNGNGKRDYDTDGTVYSLNESASLSNGGEQSVVMGNFRDGDNSNNMRLTYEGETEASKSDLTVTLSFGDGSTREYYFRVTEVKN